MFTLTYRFIELHCISLILAGSACVYLSPSIGVDADAFAGQTNTLHSINRCTLFLQPVDGNIVVRYLSTETGIFSLQFAHCTLHISCFKAVDISFNETNMRYLSRSFICIRVIIYCCSVARNLFWRFHRQNPAKKMYRS